MSKILVIEDDPAISSGIRESLESEGFRIVVENDGEAGFTAAHNSGPDLILLDIMLPSMSGLEICKKLREEGVNTPVILLTSRSTESDKLLGFDLGADDYVTKPFSIRELIARIKSILKRRGAIQDVFETFEFGEVEMNFKTMVTTKAGKIVRLSLKEYELMKYFIRHIEEVISRNKLLDEVWGYDVYPTTRTVDNYILMLRKKLEPDPSVPRYFLTMHAAGYKFVK